MALPPFDFLTSAPTDQLGTGLGKDFDYLGAYRSGQGTRNDVDYTGQPMVQVMPAPFTIGDNPDVISDMNLPEYYNFQKYMRERGAADLINPQNKIDKLIDSSSDSKGIGEIILPPIAGGSDGGGGVEGPINYNNLIVRNQNTGTGIGIDSNTSGVTSSYNITPVTKEEFAKNRALNSRFVDYNDYFKQTIAQGQFQQTQPEKTGILEKLKNFDLSKMPSIAFAKALLPKQDPRATATRDFYGDNFGLTSSGSVASGIMKDYNPVSGGGLYTLTGGKFGEEPNYGLGRAIDKRMDNIRNTLENKYGINTTMSDEDLEKYMNTDEGKNLFGIKKGHTSAAQNYFKLKSLRAKEAEALKKAQEKIQQQKDDKIAQQLAQEKIFAAQGRSDPNDKSRTGSSGRRPGSGGNGGGTQDSGGSTGGYSYDSGGRSGFGYGLKDGGRIRYGKGGIVSL